MENKIELIREIVEDYINPGLQMHDGSMEVVSCDLESDPPILKVMFHGMCGSCPSSFSQTLSTVSNFLKEEAGISDLILENVTEKPKNFNLKYVLDEDEEL
tara:strand:- start:2943 stop:3245 length:303 start_codon:yes stop_codon:yes gene_type:complete